LSHYLLHNKNDEINQEVFESHDLSAQVSIHLPTEGLIQDIRKRKSQIDLIFNKIIFFIDGMKNYK